MLIWFLIILSCTKVQVSFSTYYSAAKSPIIDSFSQPTSSQFNDNVIHREYSFGLSQFQESVDHAQANLTEAEIDFLSESLNLMVLYGERLIHQSKNLFDDYGFIVDAKRIYFFVSDVRRRIKFGINRLIDEFSANKIRKGLSRVFGLYSMNLKAVVDKEIDKILIAVNRDRDFLECWDMYKIMMFELGFEAIQELKSSSHSECGTLHQKLEVLREDVHLKSNQLVFALSARYSSVFLTRLSINTYVSFN